MNPAGLDDDEYLFWGHDNGGLHVSNSSSLPSGVNSRINHTWVVSESDAAGTAVDIGAIDMVFDLSNVSGTHNASELRLIVDTDMDGSFADETAISGATSVSGGANLFIFTGVSEIANNVKFILGFTTNVVVPTSLGTAPLGPGGVGTTDGTSNLVLSVSYTHLTLPTNACV